MNLREALASATRERARGPVAIGGSFDVDPDALLGTANGPFCFWDSRQSSSIESEVVLGLGVFARLGTPSSDRFTGLRRDAHRLFRDIRKVGNAPGPRLFGGVSFEAGHRGPFGEACFVLPRLTLTGRDALLVLDESELSRGPEILERLTRPGETQELEPYCIVDDGRREYLSMVERALGAIESGRLDKVVTRRTVRLSGAPRAGRALAALSGAPGSTRIGFSIGDAELIAATPELLCSVDAEDVKTEAVAGTVPSEAPEGALSESEKDLREHAFVVAAVLQALGSLGLHPTERDKQVRVLRHVLHLVTPITAKRSPDLHVLDVVRALHPTPAVGGAPRQAALALLTEIEPEGRGPYAAPFGWFDEAGSGVFVVGIRSAVFHSDHADVFAGGGIVAGSDPERELRETDWKLRTIFGVLGLTSGDA